MWAGRPGKAHSFCLGAKNTADDILFFKQRMAALREPANDRGEGKKAAKEQFERMIFEQVLKTYPGTSSEAPNAYTRWLPLKLQIKAGEETEVCPMCYIDALDIKMDTPAADVLRRRRWAGAQRF